MIRNIKSNTSASVLPIAAMGMVVLAALVGGAVDISRAYRVQNRLQNACDAAVLAGRRGVVNNGYDTAAQTQASKYFNINFDQIQQDSTATTFTTTADAKATLISGKATTLMPMVLMQLFGFGKMSITANCTASMGVGNSDVTLVLDTTGSMGWSMSGGTTRIQALRTAMKNFYATIATATNATNARVRYAIVPFSTTVNVGKILNDKDPRYIVDKYAVQSLVPFYGTTIRVKYKNASKFLLSQNTTFNSSPNSGYSLFSSTTYQDATSCAVAMPASSIWANVGSPVIQTGINTSNGNGTKYKTVKTTADQEATFYACQATNNGGYQIYSYIKSRTSTTYAYTTPAGDTVVNTDLSTVYDHSDYKLVLFDTSEFKKFNPVTTQTGWDNDPSSYTYMESNGTTVSSTWEGCIEERDTVPTTSASYSAVTGMNPSSALDLDIDSAPNLANDSTKWAPQWPQVAYYRDSFGLGSWGVTGYSYCPSPASILSTMTASEFGAVADGLRPEGGTYLDTGMTWGARVSSPDGIWKDVVTAEPTNGGSVARHLVFMTDGQMDTGGYLQTAWGIEDFDRRVTTDGQKSTSDSNHSKRYRAICDAIKAKGIRIWAIQFDDTTSVLQADLAYCASPNSTYAASNAAQLNAAFQEIAKQVGELRVVS